jgi:murein DD-endopeptidase MepM/ murein hydrolase activator NlpD
VVTSEFGETRTRGGGRHYRHQGIDISAPKGWPVYATADGIVWGVDRDRGGYGKHVVVQHANGYSTLYAHLSGFEVKPGQYVPAGQVLGTIGKTGRATGYHLHYEVRRNGTPINPRPFLP